MADSRSPEIVPLLVSPDWEIDVVVSDGEGFLGLANGRESEHPQILRSTDGREWFTLETTATSGGVPNSTRLDWVSLWNYDDGFMVAGVDRLGTVAPKTTVFVSGDGAEWAEFDLPVHSDPAFFVTSPSASSFVGFGSRANLVDGFIRDYTTLPVPDIGICQVSPRGVGDVEPLRLFVSDCTGASVGVIEEATVQAPFAADEVVACAERIDNVQLNVGTELLRLEPDGSLVGLGLFLLVSYVDLADGGIAAIDLGTPGSSGPCAEFVDVPQRESAVVLVDPTSNDVERVSFPAGAAPYGHGFGYGSIVGEVTVGEGRHLVVQLGDALWALDMDTGIWSGPITSPDTPLPGDLEHSETVLESDIMLSESRSRAFAIAKNLLVAFDFFDTAGGELGVAETIQPISLAEGPGSEPALYDGVLATDELFVIADRNQTWVLETPRSSQ